MRSLVQTLPNLVGQKVTLQGWTDAHRNHGKLTFIDLRDYTGKVQCVGRKMMGDLNYEDVIEIVGTVQKRPEEMINPNMLTGEIELFVESCKVLNAAKELPIPVEGDGYNLQEENRLKFRYLDLRRERMQRNIRLRSTMVQAIRNILFDNNFTEIETPLLTKSTKEGARDFVVPSRLNPGTFYALPQSPQQYKQLLMCAGFDRYFQIARCVRDEALRADRGFEFTQLDMEMSFANEWNVFHIVEDTVRYAMEKCGKKVKEKGSRQEEYDHKSDSPLGRLFFPVLDYEKAIKYFDTDKPDLRTESEIERGILSFCWIRRFPMFKSVDRENAAEVADSKSGWTFMHNPFSAPIEEHRELLLKAANNIGSNNIHIDDIKAVSTIQAQQYDLVCNGYEIGSGSIRSHTRELLSATFKIMGYTDAEIEESVGHMLAAFDVGTPPHGGIALGIDRLAMLACGESNLKEIIAFPMSASGRTSIMDAPSDIDSVLRKELKL